MIILEIEIVNRMALDRKKMNKCIERFWIEEWNSYVLRTTNKFANQRKRNFNKNKSAANTEIQKKNPIHE